jgi:hypothetical protein
MAGSKAWFDYVSDNGTTYAIEQDESNAVAAGMTPLTSAASPKVPSGMQPRYVNVLHAASGSRRRQVVGSTAADLWTGVATSVTLKNYAHATAEAVAFAVTSKIGEKQTRLPNVADTGLLTG